MIKIMHYFGSVSRLTFPLPNGQITRSSSTRIISEERPFSIYRPMSTFPPPLVFVSFPDDAIRPALMSNPHGNALILPFSPSSPPNLFIEWLSFVDGSTSRVLTWSNLDVDEHDDEFGVLEDGQVAWFSIIRTAMYRSTRSTSCGTSTVPFSTPWQIAPARSRNHGWSREEKLDLLEHQSIRKSSRLSCSEYNVGEIWIVQPSPSIFPWCKLAKIHTRSI